MARHDDDEDDIQALLNGWLNNPAGPANRPEFVVVMDIGQGNLNAVFNSAGKPFLYFDMGGGIDGSLFTYPDPAPTLCYSAAPGFILSHWDGDHYRTAVDEHAAGRLAGTVWLAPLQELNRRGCRLGLVARAKALRRNLAAAGELHLWPDADEIDRVSSSFFRVIKVTGNDMNNHGLALRIASPTGNGDFMLLTGDATFQDNTFAHGADNNCVGLISGHHTAEVDVAGDIPRPQAAGVFGIANSFGWGNAYGHPSTTGVNAYDGRNWDDDHRLDTAGGETAARYAGPRGNVGLLWRQPGLGPCAIAALATPAEQNAAAVALIACASAELELYSAGLAEAPSIAVAAAFHAGVEATATLATAAQVAAAMRAPAVPPPPPLAPGPPGPPAPVAPAPTLLGIAQAVAAVAAPLTAALTALPGPADAAAAAAVVALATAATDAVLTAGIVAGTNIRNEAVGNAVGRVIGSQARGAATSAYLLVSDDDGAGTLEAAVRAAVTDPLATAVRTGTRDVENANLPALGDIKAAVAAAVVEVARVSLGHSDTGFDGLLSAAQPPAAAASAAAAGAVAALVREDLRAAIAAAAGLMPAIPVNPEAGATGLAINATTARVARIGAVAAIVGQRAGASAADAAKAGVAAARVAMQAALGAPQINCHRHPRTCLQVCSMSIHCSRIH